MDSPTLSTRFASTYWPPPTPVPRNGSSASTPSQPLCLPPRGSTNHPTRPIQRKPDQPASRILTRAAIEELENPYQRTALLLIRWSGARRGEIRRLTLDCLDAYPDGYPRLRIPVGKTYAERMIPLHPQAADALRDLIGH